MHLARAGRTHQISCAECRGWDLQNQDGALALIFHPSGGGHAVSARAVALCIAELRQMVKAASSRILERHLENVGKAQLELLIVGSPIPGSLEIGLAITLTGISAAASIVQIAGYSARDFVAVMRRMTTLNPIPLSKIEMDREFLRSFEEDKLFEDRINNLITAASSSDCELVELKFAGEDAVVIFPAKNSHFPAIKRYASTEATYIDQLKAQKNALFRELKDLEYKIENAERPDTPRSEVERILLYRDHIELVEADIRKVDRAIARIPDYHED